MTAHAHVRGVATTRFGHLPGQDALALMAEATCAALADAGLARDAIDGVLCGYATTLPHLMLSTLFCERNALRPRVAQAVQLGGATGAAMLMQAADLVRAGRCRHVLVVAGENRSSGQARDQAIQTLAQVGEAEHEVPNGASVPAYYALMASRYLHETGTPEADLAALAVLMRRQAAGHPQAHLRDPLTEADVMASRPIATPLKRGDCCPISDGAVALVVSAEAGAGPAVVVHGAGQAHRHQHLSALASVLDTGAAEAAGRALAEAGLRREDIGHLALYDSFTITLAMLLEELGFAPRGRAGALAREGGFSAPGGLPLNTHGGLLSFGHCGVAGGLAHAAEAVRQLGQRAGARQVRPARPAEHALLHGDGGVMSSHVSLVLTRLQ